MDLLKFGTAVATGLVVGYILTYYLDKLYAKVAARRRVMRAAADWADAEKELREEHLRTKPGEHVIANEGHPFRDRGGLYRYCTRCKRRLTVAASLVYTIDGLPPCRPEPDEYERHAIVTRCDYTEDRLLEAVQNLYDAGVRP